MSREITSASAADVQLRGPWLFAGRVAWLTITAIAVSFYALNSFSAIARARCTPRCGLPAGAVIKGVEMPAWIPWVSLAGDIVCVGIFGIVALILFWRKSNELPALLAALFLVTFASSAIAVQVDPAPVPSPLWAGMRAIVVGIAFSSSAVFFYVFPDGKFVPRWTRWLVFLAVASGISMSLVSFNLPRGLPEVFSPPKPLGILLFLVIFVQFIIAPFFPLYRYLRVRDQIQRQQMKWFAFGLATAFSGAILVIVVQVVFLTPYLGHAHLITTSSELMQLIPHLVNQVFLLLIPLSLYMSILRHRLWDIDIIINRTLVYSILTVTIVGLYALSVSSFNIALQGHADRVTFLLAAGIVAVVFQPVRERLQWSVNRVMYGDRDDPYTVLSRLGQRLGGTPAPGALLTTVVETIAQALKLPYAAIALQQGDQVAIVGSVGSLTSEPLRVPLVHQGEQVGQLVVAPRPGERSFSSSERRLLDDLAQQAGIAAHSVQLAIDLQRSRERLVTLREEERRRLRRDLHDGLGPTLATAMLNINTARRLLGPDSTAEEILLEARTGVQTAIADVRRLVYDLRPPALDEMGLAGALRQTATGFEHDGLLVSVLVPEDLPPLPAAVEVAAFRIVQEALTNVVRHARARICTVQLSLTDALDVTIEDNGMGVQANGHAGVGLTSMKERAAELGGTCTITPLPGGGTRVHAHLPVQG